MGATSTVESFELAGRSGFHLMLTPFLQEIDELRSMVEVYLKARQAAPGIQKRRGSSRCVTSTSARILPEARATAELALAVYHAAAAEARNLTKGFPEPESYRTHDEHRAKMRKLTFNDLVEQNRALVGDPAE